MGGRLQEDLWPCVFPVVIFNISSSMFSDHTMCTAGAAVNEYSTVESHAEIPQTTKLESLHHPAALLSGFYSAMGHPPHVTA